MLHIQIERWCVMWSHVAINVLSVPTPVYRDLRASVDAGGTPGKH